MHIYGGGGKKRGSQPETEMALNVCLSISLFTGLEGFELLKLYIENGHVH